MSDVKLSKDADRLICLIYKYYLELKNNGFSKTDAKSFGNSRNVNQKIIPEWSFEDTDDTCRELDRASLLDIFYADNECAEISLSDNGIIYMENRFFNKIDKLVDYIDKLKPF